MSRSPLVRAAMATLLTGVVVASSSCEPIEPHPLVTAPTNVCPCDHYEPGSKTPASCSSRDRCEILTAGGRPEFPFWIVVHVPDSSIFAPGLTYVLYSDAQGNPAFKERESNGTIVLCQPPLCLPLGGLVGATAAYKVTADVSSHVHYPLQANASIPVRVVYDQIGNGQQDTFPRLPLDLLFASSDRRKAGVQSLRPLPAGTYRRVFYPEPPFDEYFPPRVDTVALKADFLEVVTDEILLGGDKKLDDQGGTIRVANVTREAGLDGWRVWLVDHNSQQRISVVKRLAGTEAEATLFTSGVGTETGGLGEDVDAVVAPPEDWMAVPRYVTPLIGGQGLKSLDLDPTPPPVTVAGVVAEPTTSPQEPLFGYAAQVAFTSQEIATKTGTSTLLSYSTTVTTDNRGRFATVLPPGTYAATITPAEGTRYAVSKQVVVVDRALTALTLQPPPRTLVKGRAVLTDGRPLREAEVLAIPNTSAGSAARSAPPRPGRTETGEDGRFALELDPGPYVLSIIPKAGTGFPRVVVRPEIPGSGGVTVQSTELPDVRVPAPTRLAFTIKDPSPTGNVVANAVVRIFALPALSAAAGGGGSGGTTTTPDPVEIGSAMTDASGAVEILLAQEPR